MYEVIKELYERQIAECELETFRHLYPQFNLDNRLTGLVGPRGVGKTTLLLQYIKQHLYQTAQAIYFSADLLYFKQTTLFDCVRELYHSEGYRVYFIDEVHKYENWNQELKNLYDGYPDIKIVFSGSSMLDLVTGGYDLSRRAKLYHLSGLSFREYLNFVTKEDYAIVQWNELLNHPNTYNQIGLIKQVKGHFKKYLERGYYPFTFENEEVYYERLIRVIDKTIFEDIANFYQLKTPHLHTFKKLLSYLSSVPPGELNTNNLAKNIGLSNQTTFHYLTILNDVGLARFVFPYETGNQLLRKPQKMFLHNTNLLYALQHYLGQNPSQGTVRELFFLQALNDANHQTFYSKIGDYRTTNTLFEIGGKKKTDKQLKGSDLPAYLVKDDILMPTVGTLPLLYFGFLH